MKRAIVTPPIIPAAALGELKGWLAISSTKDDVPLRALLFTALDLFEAFTGLIPLHCLCREILPACGDWQMLSTRPIESIVEAEGMVPAGPPFGLDGDAYELELDPDGSGKVRILDAGNADRIGVYFHAGMASEWDLLPDAVRHGIIRFAAHHYRQRDDNSASMDPPAAVAALWRPWRRMRLT
jgi:uncharacterized phiE125 gp8 family phage protein